MTEADLKEFLEKNADSIADRCNEVLLEKISQEFEWRLPSTIEKEANDFLEEKIKPVIQEQLLSQEGAIISAVKKATSEISIKIAEELTAKATKNLTSSWNMEKICKELFN